MSIFDKFKRQSAEDRLVEERMYELVAEELQNGSRREGLWVKALVNSDGVESKAVAMYIAYRVQSLKDELKIYEEVRELEAEEFQRKRQLQDFEVQKNIEREAKEILKEKGYDITKKDFGWLVIEPLGGRQKIFTVDELFQYALSREKHRKT